MRPMHSAQAMQEPCQLFASKNRANPGRLVDAPIWCGAPAPQHVPLGVKIILDKHDKL